jgi:hypothetical protein
MSAVMDGEAHERSRGAEEDLILEAIAERSFLVKKRGASQRSEIKRGA